MPSITVTLTEVVYSPYWRISGHRFFHFLFSGSHRPAQEQECAASRTFSALDNPAQASTVNVWGSDQAQKLLL
jgi:hypothetical protein